MIEIVLRKRSFRASSKAFILYQDYVGFWFAYAVDRHLLVGVAIGA